MECQPPPPCCPEWSISGSPPPPFEPLPDGEWIGRYLLEPALNESSFDYKAVYGYDRMCLSVTLADSDTDPLCIDTNYSINFTDSGSEDVTLPLVM
jgi:hypothetical protein